MKRLYTLIALLALTLGVITGCTPSDSGTKTDSGTNTPPVSTNK